ncbi:ABC transporter transmembrane domain-containing protein [uncultured Roseobacter sp.]|uniref:peptidase domain-containing ABC transporter n=1 Tax=uncultured Roseobacter sp. TaxID=114847 RepID=UPI0026247127|nr:ABC transporter transmembrane domain-containing protein [uncultured Roseobacter sp.]
MDTVIHPGLGLLQKLMMAAGWHSSHRNLTEAAPHLADQMSADDLILTLRNLDIPVSVAQARQNEVAETDCPALFVESSGRVTAILSVENGELLVTDAEREDPVRHAPSKQRGTVVKVERFAPSDEPQTFEDFRKITAGFRRLLPWLVVASFMTNLMGLATPLLIMMIYDRVIPSGATDLVVSLALGAALILTADAGFRFARSSAVAYMGRVVEHRLGLALFRKLMSLPPDQIQKSDVEQQIARFKQFEGMRDIFSGQVLTTVLDLPFILVFLGLIFALAPQVGFLVLALIVVFLLAIWVTLPVQQTLNAQAASIKAKQQKHLFETVNEQRNIYRLGLGEFWHKRYAAVAQESADASRKARRFQHLCQAFGQSLMMISGVGAIVLGTLAAMDGSMSFGALIAVMALVWKVLTPLQSLYSNAPQILGFLKSRQQVDRVLSMQQEMVRGAASSHQKEFEGRVTLSGVTHRFADATDPALSQVSLDIAPREFVVIAGNNGSGKTTLLEAIMGLHQPVVGSVQLDGIDIRQIPVDDLRQSFSYAQKKPEVFHGTLLQNFRLAAPTAHLEDIEAMIAALGLDQEVDSFPDGLNTRLTETYRKSLSSATSRGLALSRSFIRPAAVYLLNDPNAGLDYIRKAALTRFLGGLKGNRTIVLVSDDPEYIRLADRCVFMADGRIVANDTGNDGRRKISALIAANKEY